VLRKCGSKDLQSCLTVSSVVTASEI